MRIVFSSVPGYGHTYPLVPLASAARDAGHDVVFATAESFRPVLGAFGLDTVAAGIGVHEAFGIVESDGGPDLDSPAKVGAAKVGAVFGDVLPRALVAELVPLLERIQPDLVVHGATSLGAFFAAKLAGVPGICHGYGRGVSSALLVPLAAFATELAAELGVAISADAREVPVGAGDPYLDVYPSSVRDSEFPATVDRVPLRPVPVNEPGELPAWVLSRTGERPLVYLTFGTVFGAVPVIRQAIDGLRGIGADVLVAAGPSIDVDAIGGVPANVRIERWVPQADLMPHVDLLVHHGGNGTTLGALANGVPQLILPQGGDHFDTADAVVRAGAGYLLPADDQTAEAVATQVRRLLADDGVARAARAVAAEIATMPSPADTVRVLEESARA
jgi:UDP:flavonoid glycosyltransferase YjiC (YdhE family)